MTKTSESPAGGAGAGAEDIETGLGVGFGAIEVGLGVGFGAIEAGLRVGSPAGGVGAGAGDIETGLGVDFGAIDIDFATRCFGLNAAAPAALADFAREAPVAAAREALALMDVRLYLGAGPSKMNTSGSAVPFKGFGGFAVGWGVGFGGVAVG